LVSSTTASPFPRTGSARAAPSPTTSRTTFERCATSRVPAPTPTPSTVIAGRAPDPDARVVASASPVGVASSPASGAEPATSQPRASSSTAGAGTGRTPCAVRTDPDPSATADSTTRTSPSAATPAHVPTTSAMASWAPTSWKCTSSGGTPCTRASAPASRSNTASARSRTRGSRSASRIRARTSAQVRDVPSSRCWSGTATSTLVARSPARRTGCAVRDTLPGSTASIACCNAPIGTPTSTRAPSSMSPAMPAEASIQRMRVTALSHRMR
jgi:DNA polymerase-3 subunit gamma/tau